MTIKTDPAQCRVFRTRALETGMKERTFKFERAQETNEENRTMRISVASEYPVDRWGDKEILSHSPGAQKIGERQQSMPLLFNHKPDNIIGVVESLTQEGKRTYANIRFAKTPEGEKAFSLVREKILTNVSVGYAVNKYELDTTSDVYRAIDWEIMEVSLVSIPADPTVGVYRSLTTLENNQMALPATTNTKPAAPAANHAESPVQQTREAPGSQAAPAPVTIDVHGIEKRAAEAAVERVRAIQTMCRDFDISDSDADRFIRSEQSLDQVRAAVMDQLKSRKATPAASQSRAVGIDFNLGLSPQERQRYSLVRAINAYCSGNWNNAGFEREINQELSQRMGRSSQGFFMPTDLPFYGTRDAGYSAGSAVDGGNTIATDLLAGSFIDMLRKRSIVLSLGATFLTGLQGKVEIPRQSEATTAQWIPENGTVTPTNAKFDKIALNMKTIASKTFMSRNLILQSSINIENFARMELIRSLAEGIDQAALYGTGANNQPTGIANYTGINEVVGGENGAPLSFDHLIEMETLVAEKNADVANMTYLANARTIGWLKQLKNRDGGYLWKAITDTRRNSIPGELNGYPVARSNRVRSDLDRGTSKGVCSDLFFANWADLIVGEWGVIEILPNPYSSTAFDNGGVEVRALQSVDLNIRHPESFCVMRDALVTSSAAAAVASSAASGGASSEETGGTSSEKTDE